VLIVADGRHAGGRVVSISARDVRIAGRVAIRSVRTRTISAHVASERDGVANATEASARFPAAFTRS
jgi:hypothetical protein